MYEKCSIVIFIALSLVFDADCIGGDYSEQPFGDPRLSEILGNVTKEARDEFIEIYESSANSTKEELNDDLQEWAQKQGEYIEEALNQYLADEADFWNSRHETLMKEIQESNLTAKAKRELMEFMDLQQDMDIKLSEYQEKLDEISEKYDEETNYEAMGFWNMIDAGQLAQ